MRGSVRLHGRLKMGFSNFIFEKYLAISVKPKFKQTWQRRGKISKFCEGIISEAEQGKIRRDYTLEGVKFLLTECYVQDIVRHSEKSEKQSA